MRRQRSISPDYCHWALRSSHFGLTDSPRDTFVARGQLLICFSRAMAARMSGVASKETRSVRLYLRVKPSLSFCLCSSTRRGRSLVTPTSRVREAFGIMGTGQSFKAVTDERSSRRESPEEMLRRGSA